MTGRKRWQRARWQLVHVDGRDGELVVDALHLEGDDLDLGATTSGEPITVGFQAVDEDGASGLDELHGRLDAWNSEGGICDAYLLSIPHSCFVLVHADEAVVIGTGR